MSNVEKLMATLETDGIAIGGLTLGPSATAEAVAGQILRSLEDIRNGDVELIEL